MKKDMAHLSLTHDDNDNSTMYVHVPVYNYLMTIFLSVVKSQCSEFSTAKTVIIIQ